MDRHSDPRNRVRKVEQRVAMQYEQYPYPQYKDVNEIRFITAAHMERLNHHCFGGRQSFQAFNVLEAGCGTGDALLSLAKQFANMEGNLHIVGIDLSAASLKIAQKRLNHHGLSEYVTLRQISILDVPEFCTGRKAVFPKFDYIICNGVLHHMESPLLGLKALARCLKPNGCMYIMMYAKYGRLGIDLLQQFLRTLTADFAENRDKLAIAKAALDMLPDHALFKIQPTSTDMAMGDAGIYDLLLHSKNHMMALPEVFKMVKQAGLHFNKFADCPWLYEPRNTFKEPILSAILALPRERQFEMCELFHTSICNHCFYVTAADPSAACAKMSDLDNIPIIGSDLMWLRDLVRSAPNEAARASLKLGGINLDFSINISVKKFIDLVDGRRTLGKIYEQGSKDLNISRRTFVDDIREFTDLMIRNYILLLCHKDTMIKYRQPL
jgi:ubiquinone/menaquinone biosynthesis C-methylase UbiE